MKHQTHLRRAREIEGAIGRALLHDWDPIGIRDAPEAQDEYDSYVAGIYELLKSGASPQAIAEHLCGIERDAMGFEQARPAPLLPVAERLCQLAVRLQADAAERP